MAEKTRRFWIFTIDFVIERAELYKFTLFFPKASKNTGNPRCICRSSPGMKDSVPFPTVTDLRSWKSSLPFPAHGQRKMVDQGRITEPWNIILPDFITL
jgi:hypothetical protein